MLLSDLAKKNKIAIKLMHKTESLALLCSFNENSIAYANFKENTNYIKSKYKMAFVHTFNGKNSQLPQC